MISISEEC